MNSHYNSHVMTFLSLCVYRWQEQIIHPCDNDNCCSWSNPPRCIHMPIMEVQNKTER
jgi:hypothetical protein